MKKTFIFILVALVLLPIFSGCGNNEENSDKVSSTAGENADEQPVLSPSKKEVDIDLTALSSTMVYAEVSNIMISPESYVGKTIKMAGMYYASYYEPTRQYCHFIIIYDATACCAQGMEFTWKGNHVYPDDYPKEDQEIEVIGVFESYEEQDQTWYRVATDKIDIKQ